MHDPDAPGAPEILPPKDGLRVATARRLAGWRAPALAASVSVIVSLLILEVLVRLFFPQEVSPKAIAAHVDSLAPQPIMIPSRNVIMGFEMRPNYSGTIGLTQVRTDSEGFRIGDKQRNSPAGAIKIALLGDSSAFGWNVDYDQTYGALLEHQLQQQTSCPLQVRNFSVFAYNSRMELELFKERVLPWHPDILILHHDFNDAEATVTPSSYLAVEYGDNPLHSALIKFVIRRYRAYQRNHAWKLFKSDPPNKLLTVPGYTGPYTYQGPAWEDHLAALHEMADLCTKRHILPIAFIFDAFMQASSSPDESRRHDLLYTGTEQRLQAAGFSVIDLYAELQKLMSRRGWKDLTPLQRSKEDWHPGAEFHRFIAKDLANWLLKSSGFRLIRECVR
jgi:hypothetical protein